ncbi:hypothetical protein N665_0818s0020, partial [Sinapis alba]
HGKKVRDVWLDEIATEKAKDPPRETTEQKTGTRRCVKIILTRKQLELLLLKSAEGVSFKPSETYTYSSFNGFVFGNVKSITCAIMKKLMPYFPVDMMKRKKLCKAIRFLLQHLSLSLDQQEMEIQARLMEYKFHVMVAIIVTVVLSSLVYAAPRILDILAYFWPLFASTAAFLAMAITSGGFQQLSDEATSEGIMDYVTGRPEDFQ